MDIWNNYKGKMDIGKNHRQGGYRGTNLKCRLDIETNSIGELDIGSNGNQIYGTKPIRDQNLMQLQYSVDKNVCECIEHYTDISCLGGVFAKNTRRETKHFPRRMARKINLKTGIFRKHPSQTG